MSLINTVSKWNDSLITFLENPIIKYGFLIIIIIQIILIKHLSTSYLQIFDDNVFKVVYAFIIAYYACFDPVYSIALTTLMIISIQELHNRNATHNSLSLLPVLKSSKHNAKSNSNSNTVNSNSSNNTFSIKENKLTARVFDNDELVYELINKHSLQKQPDSNDKITGEYEFCQGPAYETITNNCKNENQTKDLQEFEDIPINQQGLPIGFEKK